MKRKQRRISIIVATGLLFALLLASSPNVSAGGDKCVNINFQYTDGHEDVGKFCGGNNITDGLHVTELHVSCSDKFPGGIAEKSDLDGHIVESWVIMKLNDDDTVDKICGPEEQDECPNLVATLHENGDVILTFDELEDDTKLYRSDDGGDWEKIDKIEEGETEYHDTTTEEGVSYAYSFDKYGECPVEVTLIPVFPTVLAMGLAVLGSTLAYVGLRRRQ